MGNMKQYMLFLLNEKQFLWIFCKKSPYFSYICILAIISKQELNAFAKHRFQQEKSQVFQYKAVRPVHHVRIKRGEVDARCFL